MKRLIIAIFSIALLCSCNNASSATEDEETILTILEEQEQAWNDYDIERFMEGYWKSDSLKFYGASGLTYGWQQTLDNYHKRYPSKDHTGTLKFTINDLSKINKGAYSVMGEYHLTRPVGDANGIFMLIFKKINGEWKIIADTSCAN